VRPVVDRRWGLLGVVLGVLLLASGCAHKTIIHTVPEGAQVIVDGEPMGAAPVVVERASGTGGKMRVQVQHELFEDKTVDYTRSELFFWPSLIALTPALALPVAVVAGLPFPPLGIGIAAGWFCLTSPTLISLFFIQKYPDEVTIELSPRLMPGDDGGYMPTDDWTVPGDYSPNPLPIPGAAPDEGDVDGAPADDDSDGRGDASGAQGPPLESMDF